MPKRGYLHQKQCSGKLYIFGLSLEVNILSKPFINLIFCQHAICGQGFVIVHVDQRYHHLRMQQDSFHCDLLFTVE